MAGDFANSTVGTVAFGALSGGIGAELSGGNFWEGAVIGGIVAGLNHAMHSEQAQPDPPQEDDWYTKFVNFISGGAIDEARAILAFEATNPSFGEKIMFRTGIALQNSTAETFGAKGLGAWGNYRGNIKRLNTPSNVTKASHYAKKWLGNNYKTITNKAGDHIFISNDGLRKIRFDIKNS